MSGNIALNGKQNQVKTQVPIANGNGFSEATAIILRSIGINPHDKGIEVKKRADGLPIEVTGDSRTVTLKYNTDGLVMFVAFGGDTYRVAYDAMKMPASIGSNMVRHGDIKPLY